MKNNTAKGKALRITVLYFLIGCAWILFSDKLLQLNIIGPERLFLYSTAKGILYVLGTAILIFWLIYPTLKKTIAGKEALSKANIELQKTNELYRTLNQEYMKKQALLKSLIDSIPDFIFYKDTSGVYMGCNSAFAAYVGKSEDEITGHTCRDLFPAGLAERFIQADIETLSRNVSVKNEVTVTYPDGREVMLETLKTPYHDVEGTIIGLIGISRDITERKNREERMRHISYHDVITGLHNRAYFDEIRATLDRPDNLPLSVIIGDVNGMKLINDAFGHRKGDMLLKEIASIMKQCVREGDIVARTGGDEFCILMPQSDALAVKGVVDRIRTLCREKRNEADYNIYLDIALGYATKSDPSESLDETILLAEDLMYKRKLLEQKSLHNDYLTYIKTTMFEKSNETEEHAERLRKLSVRLGREMGLSDDELDKLELVAVLHDIGKISIDKNLLTKTGKLTEAEWQEIKKHPEVGYRIANSSTELSHIAEYILCHHEHWDGSGYPLGLSGTDIPLLSRIITVVDAYDAMTQDRAYRKALPEDMAVEEILENRGTKFDPTIAGIFIEKILLHAQESENGM